jgi:hypothetical protein
MEGNTSIVGLWVPVVIFAHIFSFIWLGKLWWDYSPRRSMLRRKSATTQAKEEDASGSPKEEFVLTVARRRSGASARSSKQGKVRFQRLALHPMGSASSTHYR